MQDFNFIRQNPRPVKPRKTGITEARAAYYTPFGYNYLSDILSTMGEWIDSIKFAGGAFIMMPRSEIKRLIDLAHDHQVEVSTGGFMEYVLTQGAGAVSKYIGVCKDLGFDIIEVSNGFITISIPDWQKIIREIKDAGLKPKAEVGIQFGAGGATQAEILEREGRKDVNYAINIAKKMLEAGSYLIMVESEGITENVKAWDVEVPAKFINELGMENLMFEAADPAVFEWYIKNYGKDINLFVDHSQVVQLETYRKGIWGTSSIWGRIMGY